MAELQANLSSVAGLEPEQVGRLLAVLYDLGTMMDTVKAERVNALFESFSRDSDALSWGSESFQQRRRAVNYRSNGRSGAGRPAMLRLSVQ
jgi:hypothetical protein